MRADLQIDVNVAHDLAGCRPKTVADRPAAPCVLLVEDGRHAMIRVSVEQFLDKLPCVILTLVIHKDDLIAPAADVQHLHDSGDAVLDVLGLVVAWQDKRQFRVLIG